MSNQAVSAGNVPEEINVIIEVPAQSSPVKYEHDKDTDSLFVDRFIATPMFYPCNYGYVPNTLADDGDPSDLLVITPYPLIHGSVIKARPVGMLNMVDEAGVDPKILAVPVPKLTKAYDHINNYTDVKETLIKQIEHFFTYYKDLEKGKWVKIDGWGDADASKAELVQAVENYKKQSS